jgi:hypothetical protein
MQNVNTACVQNAEVLNSRSAGKYSVVATGLRKAWWKASCASVETPLKPSVILLVNKANFVHIFS